MMINRQQNQQAPIIVHEFVGESPEAWFRWIEEDFECNNITDLRAKRSYVMEALPKEVKIELLKNGQALEARTFEEFKRHIIRISTTEEIMAVVMDVNRNQHMAPSYIAKRICAMLERPLDTDHETAKRLFWEAMPQSMHKALALVKGKNLRTVTEAADLIRPTGRESSFAVSNVNTIRHDTIAQAREVGRKSEGGTGEILSFVKDMDKKMDTGFSDINIKLNEHHTVMNSLRDENVVQSERLSKMEKGLEENKKKIQKLEQTSTSKPRDNTSGSRTAAWQGPGAAQKGSICGAHRRYGNNAWRCNSSFCTWPKDQGNANTSHRQ